MADDKDIWDSLASDIVDGNQNNSITESVDTEVIKNLEQVAQISAAFKTDQAQKTEQPQAENRTVLFNWGHLQVAEKIGEGSYGEVYRAYDSTLDRDVALKLLKKDKVAPYQSRAFIQEARRMAKVRNRHVLAVHGANVHDSKVGMWSDLIDGTNLNYQTNRSTKDLLHILQSLSHALAAVHEAGLVHGDIKPNNIMQDSMGRISLMDFGAGIESEKELNSSGYLKGTPLYMAPELFANHSISPASDIYALGTLVFHLISDRYPVSVANLAEIKQAHTNQVYQQLKPNQYHHPKQLIALINQMVHVEPSKRPSAAQVIDKINWIKSAPQRRNKRLSLGAIFSLLILGITFTSVGFYRANKAQQLTVEEKQKTDAVNEFLSDMLESTSELGRGRDVRMADVLIGAEQSIDEKYNSQPHAKAAIFGALGNSYNSLELTEESIRMFEKSLLIKSDIYEETDFSYLKTQDDLANVLHKNNDFDASTAILEKIIAHADDKTKLKELAIIRIAQNLIGQQKYNQAIELLAPITAEIDTPETAEHNNSFLALQALTEAYNALSNYPAAEKTARQTLNWTKNYPETYQLNIMAAQTTLANVLSEQGKYADALVLFKDLYDQAGSFYGKENRGYLIHVNNYSIALYTMNRSEEAFPIQQEAYELMTKLYGEEDLNTINTAANLANIMVTLEMHEQAERLMRKTWQTAFNVVGPSHLATLKMEYNLAEFLNDTNRPQESLKMARLTSKKMADELGETHLFPMLSNDNIAVSLSQLGRYEEALVLHEKTLPVMQQKYKETSPYTILLHQHYVNTLIASEQTEKAKSQLSQLIKHQTEALGPDHKDTQTSIEQLKGLNNQ